MKKMKAMAIALALCLAASAAWADGEGDWVYSLRHGWIEFAGYNAGYNGYVNVDGMGGMTAADPFFLTVISKSASVWDEPRTNSKKLTSVSHGDSLMCRSLDGGQTAWKENGFFAVEYKVSGKSSEWREGWINEDYVVRNNLEIVLMESNVPAYIAPDTASKKVGSLSKLTRYRVIGMYDDFYIVNLRGAAAAFIPMDVRHYDTGFVAMHRQALGADGVARVKTALRTGPGSGYAKVKDVTAGYRFEAIDCIDDWYLIRYEDDLDGYGFVYINAQDAQVDGL